MAKNIDTNTNTNTTATRVVFADKAFKTRTIVLADGRTFAVEKRRIVAAEPALVDHLDKHPEFERVAGE